MQTNKHKQTWTTNRDITTTIIWIISILIQNWPTLQKVTVWKRSNCGGQVPESRIRRQIFSERLWQCWCIANSNSWLLLGLPQWLSRWRIHLQCRRHRRLGFDPWVRKTPWRRKWRPIPVFLPGKSQGQGSLAGYSPWGRKESDMTEATEHAVLQSVK